MEPDTGRRKFAAQVLYEDNHFLIVNKRAGQIVQGDKTGDIPLSDIASVYLSEKYQKPGRAFVGVAHRLDRPVSGAVILARTSKGLARINEMLRQREIEKTYWAVVANPPPQSQARLSHILLKNEKQNKSYVVTELKGNAREAVLEYQLIASSDNYHLLEIRLETGRHHQIRAQLAAAGMPIRGDLKYGYARSNPDASIHLHARSVSFRHPVSGLQLNVVAPVPDEDAIWRFFKSVT